jgi:flagella basal body P-ring formation protein FlgA
MNRTWRRILLAILVLAGLSPRAIAPPAGYAAPGSSVPSETVTVYLHASAVIEGPKYTLGQVASVYGSDPTTSQALARLPLGPTPARPTLLPARVIRERVAAVAGQAAVIGARVAILPAEAVAEDQRWFYRALLAFVEAQDACKQGRIEIELLSFPLLLEGLGKDVAQQQSMASGWEDRIVFEASRSPYGSGIRSSLASNAIPAGTMQVTYRVLAAAAAGLSGTGAAAAGPADGNNTGAKLLEGSFRIWIHHILPVARAAVDLPADYNLSEEAVIFSEEDVSLLNTSFVVQGDPLSGYKTLSSLRQGERLDGRLLHRVPAVRAGDRVMITVDRPGLRVSLPGRALRSGGVGELIDVRPDATTKRLQARITSKGEVLVESD